MPRRWFPPLAALSALLLGVAVALSSAPAPTPPTRNLRLQSLVAAEREFSARSVRNGMKDAFLAYLAEDGVIFRPVPTNGRESWKTRENPKGTLIWEPTFAEVSEAGDLGVDSGPWEYRLPGDSTRQQTLHGHFVSVWKRVPKGPWRVAADLGVSHRPPPSEGLGSGALTAGPAHQKLTGGSALDLRKLDVEYAEATRQNGVGAAFAAIAAPDIRLYREGSLPFLGREAARTEMDSLPGNLHFIQQGNRLSASRDLGYTYGIAQRFDIGDDKAGLAADSLVYLHVWRQNPDRSWRLSLAVLNPLPRTRRE
jgi:ketosteroid isomerase-like protein